MQILISLGITLGIFVAIIFVICMFSAFFLKAIYVRYGDEEELLDVWMNTTPKIIISIDCEYKKVDNRLIVHFRSPQSRIQLDNERYAKVKRGKLCVVR